MCVEGEGYSESQFPSQSIYFSFPKGPGVWELRRCQL